MDELTANKGLEYRVKVVNSLTSLAGCSSFFPGDVPASRIFRSSGVSSNPANKQLSRPGLANANPGNTSIVSGFARRECNVILSSVTCL